MAKRAILVFGLIVIFTCLAYSQADYNGMLKGVYGYTESFSCVQAKANEDGTYPPLPHFVEVSPGMYQLAVEGVTSSYRAIGVISFDGEGGLTSENYNLGIEHQRTAAQSMPLVFQPPLDCTGTYAVNADRSLVVDIPDCTGTIPGPGDVPLTLKIGGFVYKGYIGSDPHMIVLGNVEPVLGRGDMFAPDSSLVGSFEGLCISSQTLIRLDSDPLNFAQFANGFGGLSSDITLTNPTSVLATGSVAFANDQGEPMAVGVVGEDAPVSSVDFAVEPHGSVVISTDPEGQGGVGSATAIADRPVAGVLRFTFPGAGIAGVASSGAYDGFIVAASLERGGVNTGIAIQNAGNHEVDLIFILNSQNGEELARATGTSLTAGGHMAKMIDELFPEYLGGLASFRGTLVVQAEGGSVAATALELDLTAGAFTTLPVTGLK